MSEARRGLKGKGAKVRLGLIGCTGHWRTYAQALQQMPELEISAVSVAAPEERLEMFERASGVSDRTQRYTSPEALLDSGMVDAVQVSTRSDLITPWIVAAVERGLPVMAEKPVATALEGLQHLAHLVRQRQVLVSAMHTQRGSPLVAAVREIVRRGDIGRPLVAHNQKSYRWGASRPDAFRSRDIFPGVAPYIGIHVFDWLLWILGDRFASVTGTESAAARPDYAACASHAGYLFRLTEDGIATVTLDYLRPETAPTHGDERIRIAGTAGVVEVALATGTGTLIDAKGVHDLAPPLSPPWYTSFLRAVRGDGPPLIPSEEVFRVTEVALKAQVAVDKGREVDLRESRYRIRD